ncbi:MAG: glycosyltransferase family 1 protein, partial [Dolichospermum sp.]
MDNLTTVIAIVPRLPPAIDGVGDYALNLARQLRKDFNIHTHFIVGNSTWQGAAEIEGFTISQITDNSASTLVSLLSSNDKYSSILLHYVGYGYAQRGCPVWLVQGLERWKSLYPKNRLVTMFHEISASGPPWTSAFWLSSLQRDLAARLTKLSDRCITSKQLYADIITQISRGKHNQVLFLPVFSNVGEPEKLPPDLSERQQRLVIFGGVANRARVYNQSQKVLNYVCQRLNIQEIYDIGTPTGITPSFIGKVPILEIGEQPAHKVSDILTNSIAGFCDYNPDFLAKSGIFAAYCAYRLLPINAKESVSIIDGIESGKNYWTPDIGSNDSEDQFNWQTVA